MWLIPELVVWKFRNIWKSAPPQDFFLFFPLKSFQWETSQWSQKMRKKKCPSHTGTLKNRFSYLDPGDIKDTGSIPGLGRSPGGGHGKRLPWWLSRQRIHLQCWRPGFDPWVGKMPWKRAWQPIPVSLPGESPWTEEPGGYSPWGCKELDTTEWLSLWIDQEDRKENKENDG